jgi:RNA polymerase sigma-70 factor, ECF subfamily
MARIDIDEATETHFARIHRAALVLCGNPWDADDLVQETFLVAARQAGDFQGRSTVYTWLYGILLNLDRRERRRQSVRRRKLQVLWDNGSRQERTAPGANVPVEVAEWKQNLWSRVHQLPEAQRQILVLRFSEGLEYEDIAQVVGCPLGTVKSRIYYGLAALKRMLEQQDDAQQSPKHPTEDIQHAV